MSVGELSKMSGINVGELSRFENGKMIPTAEQYDKVTAALREVEDRAAGSGSATPPAAVIS